MFALLCSVTHVFFRVQLPSLSELCDYVCTVSASLAKAAYKPPDNQLTLAKGGKTMVCVHVVSLLLMVLFLLLCVACVQAQKGLDGGERKYASLADSWVKYLMRLQGLLLNLYFFIPSSYTHTHTGVSETVANTVVASYPTFRSLMNAYDQAPSEEARRTLLQVSCVFFRVCHAVLLLCCRIASWLAAVAWAPR